MRATTLLSRLLQVKQARFVGLAIEDGAIVADVALSTRVPRCSGCQRRTSSVHDRYPGRRWRHLDLAGIRIELRCDLRRVRCRRCGVRVEAVPWAAPGSRFSCEFEEQVAYLAQRTDRTTVSELMRIAWVTVGQVVSRVVGRWDLGDRLEGLVRIGVDELSYRRHHEYVTVVVDHDRGRVVWARRGKDAATLAEFFQELGSERCRALEVITMDMSSAYRKAVEEAEEVKARLVFDRFHVQRLAHDALDEVRRAEVREASEPAARRAVKRTRWALQKNPWNLTSFERERLSCLQRANRTLYRAYLLKESLAEILDRRQVNVAREKLEEWVAWAKYSQLAPFRKLAATVRSHAEGILAYVATGLSNGRSEGLNGKIRTLTRRAYGFHSAESLIALIFLCCSGVRLAPIHKSPVPS
jgi:transposase